MSDGGYDIALIKIPENEQQAVLHFLNQSEGQQKYDGQAMDKMKAERGDGLANAYSDLRNTCPLVLLDKHYVSFYFISVTGYPGGPANKDDGLPLKEMLSGEGFYGSEHEDARKSHVLVYPGNI